jgi:tRNA dimethylallyltransferase
VAGRRAIEALVVIGGSTASGKSDLALRLARAVDGVIVNADSQQLFADLPILTARPTAAEQASSLHRLYGLLDAAAQPSVGRWLALVEPVLAETWGEGRPAIVVGGTGLYLHALLHGMPAMPEIPAWLRAGLRTWAATVPAEAAHARLQGRDPELAAHLQPGDRQRVLRALEVIEATGRSLRQFQSEPRRRISLPGGWRGVALLPPPASVNRRIERRLEAMLAVGALYEVRALLARRPDSLMLPIAKVQGMRELAAVAQARLGLQTARALIAAGTRQYAKRQRTWFRHQLPELSTCPQPGEDLDPLALFAGLGRTD